MLSHRNHPPILRGTGKGDQRWKNESTSKTSSVAHAQGNQDGIELGLQANLSTIPKTKIDVQSPAAALEQSMRIAETPELKQEGSNLS